MGNVFGTSENIAREGDLWSPTDPSRPLSADMEAAYQRCLRAADEASALAAEQKRGVINFSCKFPLSDAPEPVLDTDTVAFQAVIVTSYLNHIEAAVGGLGIKGWVMHHNSPDGTWHVEVGRFDRNNWKRGLITVAPADIVKLADTRNFNNWVRHRCPNDIQLSEEVEPRVRQTWGRRNACRPPACRPPSTLYVAGAIAAGAMAGAALGVAANTSWGLAAAGSALGAVVGAAAARP